METKKYTVLKAFAVEGVEYEEGGTATLTDDQVAALPEGSVQPAEGEPAE